MKKLFSRFCATILFVFCFALAYAQDTLGVQQVAALTATTPTELVSDASVSALMAALVALLAFFSKLFPGLGQIPDIKVRAFALAIITIVGAIHFKIGFFNFSTLPFFASAALTILSAFGVTGGAGLIYDLLKFFTGGKVKSIGQ